MTKLTVAIAAEFELCEKIAEFLEKSELPVEKLSIVEITPFGEEQGVRFNNRAVAQLAVDEVEWSEFNYLLFAGDTAQATHIANAAEAGCVVIDIKGVTANIAGVPVVVPSANDEHLAHIKQRNIVAMPDPQVSQLVLSLSQCIEQYQLTQLFVTSMLPTSYTDGETVSKLAGQTAHLLNGIPLDDGEQRLAFDVFPKSAVNLSAQLQKIYPTVNAVFHAIQAPVFYGMGQKVTALSAYELDPEQIKAQWQGNELLQVEDNLITPVLNGEQESHEESVKLHLSNLSAVENGIEFWSVADEQRFNLALLAVKLLETIEQRIE
ncbi:aspartate-semialdehyde dehydrogenase [Pasteurella langaaensis DSM 22999]|uniref:Aspartate-semialdehyde dehydrogenase n=1 Tax=Alitibacter langaaensis DSM 22999 TaxID=1122935 RepID=A0A2U0SQ50_9PAST|nr:oxidoreductase [Pasteurella langaaensis]PVX33479.1 aspartate-semialdehyde dehydrogenase [Pasteurella langaaensis DSM 22999]